MLRIHLIPQRSYTSKADLRQTVEQGFATYGQRLRDKGDKEPRLAASSIHGRVSLRSSVAARQIERSIKHQRVGHRAFGRYFAPDAQLLLRLVLQPEQHGFQRQSLRVVPAVAPPWGGEDGVMQPHPHV